MLEKAKNLVKEINEVKGACMKLALNEDMFEYMSGEEFEFISKTMKLMDDSLDLVLEQAKLFTEMDEKLDRLIKKLEA